MVVLWLCYGCVVVVLWLWLCCGCVMVVLWLCYGRVTIVWLCLVLWLWLCCGCVVVVLWLCYGCVMVVLWLCYGCVVVVLWLCCGCVVVVLWLCGFLLTSPGVEPVVITGSQFLVLGQFHRVHPVWHLELPRPERRDEEGGREGGSE